MAQGIQLSVPAKTFVVGEYLALKGGPSLIACTEPRFLLKLSPKKTKSESLEVFHSESPAGKFLNDHLRFFSHWNLEFHDPYNGLGGFGASTAQFALLYMAELIMREGDLNSDQMQWSELLRDYHLYSYGGVGLPPSGADLIAQLTGGMVVYDGQKMDVQSSEWPFKDLGFLLFHTGEKLATHEHLKKELEIPVELLRSISQKTVTSLTAANAKVFSETIQTYGENLAKLGYLAESSSAKLNWLKESEAGSVIVAAKGCGAMGSDVLFVLYAKSGQLQKANDWREWLNSKGNPANLNLVASDETISVGLKVEEYE